MGFNGPDCATDVDECASEPCLNGGTCVDGIATFTCECSAGFDGEHCQTNINDCAGAPCLNEGQCFDEADGFACVCAAGYRGGTCATDINECAESPCQDAVEPGANLLADTDPNCPEETFLDVNPLGPDNIMYRGHLAYMMAMYRQQLGDTKYEDSFELRWTGTLARWTRAIPMRAASTRRCRMGPSARLVWQSVGMPVARRGHPRRPGIPVSRASRPG
ncbi:MAG: hypothetical protein ACI9WU_001362 [Myxococcota bacterium]|jgi:hypothetical protein